MVSLRDADAAKALVAAGVETENFRSFPSGHVSFAGTLFTLVPLAWIVPALSKQEKMISIVAFVWVMLTMLGRIVCGFHFLSDVTAGALLIWTILLVLQPRKNKPRDLQ